MISRTFLLSFVLLALLNLSSCYDSEDFSDDPSLQLIFSSEELRFDTIFTNVKSPLLTLKVYNRNNHSVMIDHVYLNEGDLSEFRLNVNGRPGSSISNIEILKEDSIYLFLEAKNSTSDFLIQMRDQKDKLTIEWNQNVKTMNVSALLKPVIVFDDIIVSTDTIIDQDCYINGNVNILPSGKLTVAKGTTLFLGEKSSIRVNGILEAKGTFDYPVIFRGNKVNVGEDHLIYDNHTAQWGGLVIEAESYNNLLENTIVKNATEAIDIQSTDFTKRKLTLKNSIVHNALYFGIRAINADLGIYNSQITNSYGPLIEQYGGNLSVIQSTVANYFSWYARGFSSVVLGNEINGASYNFNSISIVNSLLVGSRKEEFLMDAVSTSFLFKNNLVQTQTTPSFPFTSCFWNIDSPFVFENVNFTKDYSYSFKLSGDSNPDVFGNADPIYAESYPLDVLGYPRPVNGADIGCYQHR